MTAPAGAARAGRLLLAPAAAHLGAVASWAILRGPAYNPDAVSYDALARLLLEGRLEPFVTATWSPAYPALLAPALAIGADPFRAALALAAAAGVAAILLLRPLGRAFGLGEGPVGAAAWLLAFSPLWWAETTLVAPDVLLAPLFAVLLGLLLRLAASPGPRRAALAGLVAGGLFWVRAYMLPFGLAALVPLALAMPRGRRLRASFAYLAALAAAAAPWLLAMGLRYGRFVVSSPADADRRAAIGGEFRDYPVRGLLPTGPGNLVDCYPPGSPLWNGPPPGRRIPWPRQAAATAANLVFAARFLANPGYGLVLLLAAAGLAAAWRTPRRRAWLLAAALAAIYVGGYALVQVRDRYFLAILPLLFLLAGRGLFALPARGRGPAVLLLAAIAGLQGARRGAETVRRGEGRAGAALREAGALVRRSGADRIGAVTSVRVAGDRVGGVGRTYAVALFGEALFAAIENPGPPGTESLGAAGVRFAVVERSEPSAAAFLAAGGWRRRGAWGPFGSGPAADPGFELWEAPPR